MTVFYFFFVTILVKIAINYWIHILERPIIVIIIISIVGLQVGLFQCPASEAQWHPGNFQKLLEFEGWGKLPPEILIMSGHWSVPDTLSSPLPNPWVSVEGCLEE